jgi:hypothetical protein
MTPPKAALIVIGGVAVITAIALSSGGNRIGEKPAADKVMAEMMPPLQNIIAANERAVEQAEAWAPKCGDRILRQASRVRSPPHACS